MPMQPQPIPLTRVLIVEDDPFVQERMRRLMVEVAGRSAFITVVADMSSARDQLRKSEYSLALVDVRLPDGSGIDVVGWMRVHVPGAAAVIVSAWAEETIILSAIRAGAVGYLLKERDDAEIALSLKSLQQGGAPLDPMIARRILALFPSTGAEERTPASGRDVDRMSQREIEVLKLVAQGFTNREIAGLLSLSRLTIECHNKNIYRKLSVGSRTEAVFEAKAMGLLM